MRKAAARRQFVVKSGYVVLIRTHKPFGRRAAAFRPPFLTFPTIHIYRGRVIIARRGSGTNFAGRGVYTAV